MMISEQISTLIEQQQEKVDYYIALGEESEDFETWMMYYKKAKTTADQIGRLETLRNYILRATLFVKTINIIGRKLFK